MPAWLQHDWCSSFVLAMGHFLWQGALIAVVLAVALRTTKTVSVRYWLSLTALLVMAVSPMLTLGWLMCPISHVATFDATMIVREEPAPSQPIIPVVPIEEPSDVGHVSNVPVSPSIAPLGFNTTATNPLQVPANERSWWQKFAPQLTTMYLCGVALMLLRLVFGLWGGRRLRRRVHLIDDPSLLAAMQRQAAALGLKLLPVLAYCERVTVPTVVGVLKPMILLPLTLTSGLSPEQMESVLAHELAHLRRNDHLVNLLQRVIESLLFFHPAMWWVSHRIRDEREHCCDDLVVVCGAMPLDYAKSLLVVAELSRASPLRRSIAAVSLLATGHQKPSNLRQRIARLLGESATPSLRVSPRALLVAIGIPLIALIVAIQSGVSNPTPPDEEQIRQEQAAYQVLHQLKSRLSVCHTDADGEYEVEQFRRGEELDRLRVHDPVRPLAERRLAKPLREATIWFVKDVADWALIGELQSIERLSFTASDLRGHMDELKKLTRLRRFEVFNSKFDFDDLAKLSQHPQLEQIEVMSSIFDGSDEQIAKQLGEMTDDERQWLDRWIASRSADSPNHRVAHAALLTDRALRNFGELKQLKTLKLINTFATGRSAETLSELTRLEELDVSFLSLDADAGRNLSRLRRLKRLGNSDVNDAALAELAALPELEHVEFWCKEVTDAGATSLSRCRKLRHLLLGTSQITDAGLDALSDLPDLRVLDLRFGAKAVTVEAIERFRVRHPDCNLVLSDDSLDAGFPTPPNNANGDLRSKPAVGSGDPRRAQLSDIFERLRIEEQKYARIQIVVRSQQRPFKWLDQGTQQSETVRQLIRDHDRSYYLEERNSRILETGATSRTIHEETIQGRWWRQRIESTEPSGRKHSDDSLFVLPKVNHRLGSHTLALGSWFERPDSLSDLLTDETPGRRKIVDLVGEETIDAERCVKLKEQNVSAGSSKFYQLIWLALDKNLLPCRVESRDGTIEGQPPASMTQVTEWQALQPGIWFPKRIEYLQPRKSATASDKLEMERTNTLTVELVTLQPKIERSLFDKLGKPPSNEPVVYKCRVITTGTKAPIAGATVVFKRTLLGDPRFPNERRHLIEKTTHVTDAGGWYEVTIPPEQLAEKYLYVELEVTHSEHVSRIGEGYAMSMIRKNELAGARPFFETTILHPGRAATGTVVTPDGRPAADVKVVGFCDSQPLDRGARIATRTDAAGKYRVVVPASGGGAFWLVPDDACPLGVVVSKEGGDLGTQTLKRGLRPSGQVLDADGRAIAGMHVAMSRQDSESPDIDRVIRDAHFWSAYSRDAVTDSEGRFVMPPVEPGKYEFEISPNAQSSPKFSGTFLIQSMSIDANAKPLELRAVPSVEIRAQNVDSKGQPYRGFEFNITGEINGQYFVGESSRPNDGRSVARVPRGLKEVEVRFFDNEHGIVRIRRKPGAPLESIDRLKIPSIDEDIEGIEVVRYKSPILLVKAVDAANQSIADFTPNITYTTARDPKVEESEEAHEVRLEHQADGRWRTKSFFPDEEVTVSVAKKGWKAEPQKLRMAEGEERELVFVLKPIPEKATPEELGNADAKRAVSFAIPDETIRWVKQLAAAELQQRGDLKSRRPKGLEDLSTPEAIDRAFQQTMQGLAKDATSGERQTRLRYLGDAAFDSLVKIARSDDPTAAAWCCRALTHRGAKAVAPLSEILKESKHEVVRSAAATALGQTFQPAGVPALIQALDDRPSVRDSAISALRYLRDQRAVEPLKKHLEDPVFGHLVADALKHIAKPQGYAYWPPELLDLWQLCENAHTLAGETFGPPEWDRLAAHVDSEDFFIAGAAQLALGHLDVRSKVPAIAAAKTGYRFHVLAQLATPEAINVLVTSLSTREQNQRGSVLHEIAQGAGRWSAPLLVALLDDDSLRVATRREKSFGEGEVEWPESHGAHSALYQYLYRFGLPGEMRNLYANETNNVPEEIARLRTWWKAHGQDFVAGKTVPNPKLTTVWYNDP